MIIFRHKAEEDSKKKICLAKIGYGRHKFGAKCLFGRFLKFVSRRIYNKYQLVPKDRGFL